MQCYVLKLKEKIQILLQELKLNAGLTFNFWENVCTECYTLHEHFESYDSFEF